MITTETKIVNQTPAYRRRMGLPLDPDVQVTVHTLTGVIADIILDPSTHGFPVVVIDGDRVQVADFTYWDGSQWVGIPALGDYVTASVEPLPNGEWLAGGLTKVEQ